MKKLNHAFPLINEPHPENYKGPPFLTLIRFNDVDYINIVDNVINNEIIAYVLDLCPKEFEYLPDLKEQAIIEVAYDWYERSREKYPLSIEFSRRGMAVEASKIIRRFSLDYVSRVIGPLWKFEMGGPYKIKKRKRKPIPPYIEFTNKLKDCF